MESKNSAAPAHFIQGLRHMPRRKKHPRMNKESPSCQEGNHKKEKRHAFKDNLLGHPKQKRLTQWASHGSMVEEKF